uniref:Uncharacterized protein n=1 Tax=Plectus sambesii TaxID=2011161 RepID=A0A914X8F8_9BILA
MSTAEDDLKWCGEIRHTADHRTTNWRMGNWVINKSGYLVASSTSGHIECRKHLKDLSKLPPRPPTGCMLNIDFSGASMSIRFKEDPKLAADLFEVIKMKVERIGPVTLSRSVQKNSASNSSALSSSRSSGGGLVGVVRSTAKSLPVSKKPQNAAESSRYSPVVEALSSSARSSQAKTNTPPDAAVFASPSVATPSAIIWDENSAFDDVVRETPEERWPVANHDSRRELSTTQTPIAAHLANLFNADSPLPEDKENRPNVRRPANPSRGPLASNVQASLPTESFYGKNSVSSQPEIRRALTAFDRSPEKRALRKRKRGPLQGYLSEYSPKHRRTLTDANQIKFGNENLSPFKYSSVGRTPEKDFASASFQG